MIQYLKVQLFLQDSWSLIKSIYVNNSDGIIMAAIIMINQASGLYYSDVIWDLRAKFGRCRGQDKTPYKARSPRGIHFQGCSRVLSRDLSTFRRRLTHYSNKR